MRFFKLFILFSLFSAACSSPKETSEQTHLPAIEVSYIDIHDSVAQTDSLLESYIAPYRDSLKAQMNRVIGISKEVLTKNTPEGTLGNFVADLSLSTAKKQAEKYHLPSPDFCVMNNGGLRVALPKGEITVGKIFELMPFENELVEVELPPQQMKELFNYIAEKNGVPVSGIRLTYQNKKLVKAEINNMPWDSTKTYLVCTSDYLASGGDHMSFFINQKQLNLNIKLRDAIIQHIEALHQKNKVIEPVLDKRIQFE